jgi:hypothetical protein
LIKAFIIVTILVWSSSSIAGAGISVNISDAELFLYLIVVPLLCLESLVATIMVCLKKFKGGTNTSRSNIFVGGTFLIGLLTNIWLFIESQFDSSSALGFLILFSCGFIPIALPNIQLAWFQNAEKSRFYFYRKALFWASPFLFIILFILVLAYYFGW